MAFLLTGLSLILLNLPTRTTVRRILILILTGCTMLLVFVSTLTSFPEFSGPFTLPSSKPFVLPLGFPMSHTSAIEFILTGLTILLLSEGTRSHLAYRRILTAMVFLIAMFALSSIVLNDSGHQAIRDFGRIHAFTAVLFILTSTALFFSDENDSIATLMSQRGRGTRIAQLMFILSFAIPMLTEMLVQPIIHSGRLDQGNSKAIGVLLNGIIFSAMAILMGSWIRRSEQLVETSHRNVIKSEELLRKIFEALPVGILILDRQGTVQNANPVARAITGMGNMPPEVTGNRIRAIFNTDGQAISWEALINGLHGPNKPQRENEAYRFILSDGGVQWMTFILTPIEIGEIGSILVMTDVTGLKQTEASLSESGIRLRELLARLTVVEEETRKQAAMVLHDQVGQNLTALIISLQYLSQMIASGETGTVDKTLEDALTILKETVQKTKSIIYELRPSVLDDYGLYPALQWYAGQLSGRTSVKVTAEGRDLLQPLPSASENAMFRIVQEACTNSLRHSGATSIVITLSENERMFRLEVCDNGCGFDPDHLHRSGTTGLGLTGMKERAHLTGGTLEILSRAGEGTRVVLTIQKKR